PIPWPMPWPLPMPFPEPCPMPFLSSTPRSLARSIIRSWWSWRYFARSASVFRLRMVSRCCCSSCWVISSRPKTWSSDWAATGILAKDASNVAPA
ncbi:MAG TPA: hypothetical protein DEG64_16405, partial [Marinobacter adhaerens]|nr:hypothetical protein [Marinobacter adhaerens]